MAAFDLITYASFKCTAHELIYNQTIVSTTTRKTNTIAIEIDFNVDLIHTSSRLCLFLSGARVIECKWFFLLNVIKHTKVICSVASDKFDWVTIFKQFGYASTFQYRLNSLAPSVNRSEIFTWFVMSMWKV